MEETRNQLARYLAKRSHHGATFLKSQMRTMHECMEYETDVRREQWAQLLRNLELEINAYCTKHEVVVVSSNSMREWFNFHYWGEPLLRSDIDGYQVAREEAERLMPPFDNITLDGRTRSTNAIILKYLNAYRVTNEEVMDKEDLAELEYVMSLLK